jgi:hypothetical protein
MKDVIAYMIDYLPSVIEVKLPDGRQIGYELRLFSNFGRGFTMFYCWEEAWSSFDVEEEYTRLLAGEKGSTEEKELDALLTLFETYGEGSSPRMIWGAEYIRSLKELESSARALRTWLKTHGFVEKRIRNTKAKTKLFSVITSE